MAVKSFNSPVFQIGLVEALAFVHQFPIKDPNERTWYGYKILLHNSPRRYPSFVSHHVLQM